MVVSSVAAVAAVRGQGRGGQSRGRSQQAPRRQDGEAPKARTRDGKPPRRRRPRKTCRRIIC